MKKITSLLLSLWVFTATAQTNFVQYGRIEYEKKSNQHTPLEEEADNVWNAERIKAIPKFVTDIYELRFNNNKSVYKLAKENPDNKYMMWGAKPNETDAIVTDFLAGTISSQKDIFENTYLLKDSIRNLEWKDRKSVV